MVEYKEGSVIQGNEKAAEWCGCLLIVTEIKDWGVQAALEIPFQGVAYIRLKWDQFEYIGEAIFIPGK